MGKETKAINKPPQEECTSRLEFGDDGEREREIGREREEEKERESRIHREAEMR